MSNRFGDSLILFVVFSNYIIIQSTEKDIYSTISDIPEKNVALILGTSKYTIGGYTNLFFKYRIAGSISSY